MARYAAPFWCEAPYPLNLTFFWFFNSSCINYEALNTKFIVWYPLITTPWNLASLSKVVFALKVSLEFVVTWCVMIVYPLTWFKTISSWENIIWRWFYLCVIEPICILWYAVICVQHMSRQNLILIYLLLINRILFYCLYFIRSEMKISKLIGRTFGDFIIGHCPLIFLKLHTPYVN